MNRSIEEMEGAELLATASYSAGRLERFVDTANGHFVTTSGWLTASLFAMNGAGLLAALNIADRLNAASWCGGMFGAGIVFAMLNAAGVQELLQRQVSAAEPIINYWRLVETLGAAKPDQYDELAAAYRRVLKWAWLPPTMGWLSGLLFIGGGIVLAVDASERSKSFTRTCYRLQREMLSTPTASGPSRDTFTALGCRYQN